MTQVLDSARTPVVRRVVAAMAGTSAVVASLGGTVLVGAAPAYADPAPGQDVLNDWGQTANDVDLEVAAIVDTDPRVVTAIARYSRAVSAYWSIKQVQRTAYAAHKAALGTRSAKDDRRTKRRLKAVNARVLSAAREVVASQLAMVRTVAAVEAAVRATHYVKAPYVAVPATPTGLAAAAATGQVSLTWDATDGATSYRVYRDGAQVATTVLPAYVDTTVTDGELYAYTVIAQNVAGWSGISAEVIGAPTATAPSVPTSLVVSPGDGSATLAWAASSSATGYRIYRGGVQVGTSTTTGFIDTGLANGTSYSWTVVAVNGTVSSAPSSPVTGTPVATPPAAPTALSATPGNGQVALTWTASSGATGYRVYRNGTLVGSPASTGYTDTGLTNGTAYSWTVAAVRQNSAPSAQSSPVTATPVVPPLAAPSGLAATPGDRQVALSWTAVSGATSYQVYRGATLVGSPTGTTFTDTGLVNGTAYSWTVVAVNASTSSPSSSAVSATPVAAAPGAPTGLTGQAGDQQAVLTWTAVGGASGYKVYRGTTYVTTVASPAYTATGLTNGTAYSFYVTAVVSGVESAPSATVSVTPYVAQPAIPTGLVATPGNAQVVLSWSAALNASSYRVYRGATLVGSPTGTTFTDTGLVNGTAYSWTVVAVNGSASSAASSAVTATPLAPAPGAPTGLSVAPGNASAVLTWTATPTATSYRVYRGATLVGSPTSPTYTDTGLVNGTAYSWTVVAVNQTTPGPASTAVSGTPTAPLVNGTFTGPITTITGHGTMRVVIVLTNSVITKATGTLLTNDGSETVSINTSALPKYDTKAVTANSASITKVSGATLTYNAYKASLSAALTASGR
ncbi:MAG: hypothetical protein U0S36_01330 [Candidatus Nanopelagicales bacterium]